MKTKILWDTLNFNAFFSLVLLCNFTNNLISVVVVVKISLSLLYRHFTIKFFFSPPVLLCVQHDAVVMLALKGSLRLDNSHFLYTLTDDYTNKYFIFSKLFSFYNWKIVNTSPELAW